MPVSRAVSIDNWNQESPMQATGTGKNNCYRSLQFATQYQPWIHSQNTKSNVSQKYLERRTHLPNNGAIIGKMKLIPVAHRQRQKHQTISENPEV
jgi:hypothetical protein